MSQIRVGVSGWTYPPWRGNFYPARLPQRLELAYASRRFNALEVNGTFYSLQRPASFASWYDATPPGFVFALKGGRYITHMRKLRDAKKPLANFLASGPLALREKLGPILWQFPPFLTFNEARFRAFFELLPHDTLALARLAKEHDRKLKGRTLVEADRRRPVRHAVEFRHESFLTDRFVNLLREFNVALVVADVAGKFPTAEDVTADWVYVRLHGARKLYVSGYTLREIAAWAAKIRAWHAGRAPAGSAAADRAAADRTRVRGAARPRLTAAPAPLRKSGRDVFVFFDNTDIKLRAPVDARRLAETLGTGPFTSVRSILSDLGVAPAQRARPSHP